jgi:hypothetical protein
MVTSARAEVPTPSVARNPRVTVPKKFGAGLLVTGPWSQVPRFAQAFKLKMENLGFMNPSEMFLNSRRRLCPIETSARCSHSHVVVTFTHCSTYALLSFHRIPK